MSEPAPAAKFPWVAVLGVFALALIGVALLAFAMYSFSNSPAEQAAAPTATTSAAAATPAAAIPTTLPTEVSTATQPATATPPPTEAGAAETAAAETAAAQATPTPGLTVSIILPANVRSGPGQTYERIGGLDAGETPALLGRDTSAQWYAIAFEGAADGTGWVANLVASFDGDVNSLPVIEAASPPPAATQNLSTAAPAAATNTAPPPATNTAVVLGSRGIVANYFRVRNTTAGVGQDIWFEFQVTNTTANDIAYGVLAAHTDVGFTAQSWTNETLKAGQALTWDDHINIDTAGTYQLYLGICYADREACVNGSAPWERLSNNVTVTVQ